MFSRNEVRGSPFRLINHIKVRVNFSNPKCVKRGCGNSIMTFRSTRLQPAPPVSVSTSSTSCYRPAVDIIIALNTSTYSTLVLGSCGSDPGRVSRIRAAEMEHLTRFASSLQSSVSSTVFSTVSAVNSVLPGNPVTREFEATEHVASAGPGTRSDQQMVAGLRECFSVV